MAATAIGARPPTSALLSAQRLKPVAVGGSAVAIVLFGVAAALGVAVPGDDGVDAVEIGFLAAFLSFALVGGLIAWHRPGNPVGWLLLATGLAITLSATLDGYAYYAIVHRDGSVPGGLWARWAQSWLFVLAWDVGTTLPLLFFPRRPVAVPALALVDPVDRAGDRRRHGRRGADARADRRHRAEANPSVRGRG